MTKEQSDKPQESNSDKATGIVRKWKKGPLIMEDAGLIVAIETALDDKDKEWLKTLKRLDFSIHGPDSEIEGLTESEILEWDFYSDIEELRTSRDFFQSLDKKHDKEKAKGLVEAAKKAIERFEDPYLDSSFMEKCQERVDLEEALAKWEKDK